MAKVGYVMNYAGYRANTDKEWMKRLWKNSRIMSCVRNGTNYLTD